MVIRTKTPTLSAPAIVTILAFMSICAGLEAIGNRAYTVGARILFVIHNKINLQSTLSQL